MYLAQYIGMHEQTRAILKTYTINNNYHYHYHYHTSTNLDRMKSLRSAKSHPHIAEVLLPQYSHREDLYWRKEKGEDLEEWEDHNYIGRTDKDFGNCDRIGEYHQLT